MKQKTVTDSHDIALHFNPRLKENIIVRNTYQNSQWGDEERNGGSPLKAGCDFTLYIVCEEHGYRIHINDNEYTFYSHRIPPTSITHLRIKGLLTLCNITYKSTSVSETFYSFKQVLVSYLDLTLIIFAIVKKICISFYFYVLYR